MVDLNFQVNGSKQSVDLNFQGDQSRQLVKQSSKSDWMVTKITKSAVPSDGTTLGMEFLVSGSSR